MKFTQIPANTFEQLQLNAGVLLSEFDPAEPVIDRAKILGATTGGNNFTDVPTYEDFAADVDNAPKNMKEFKRITERAANISGTFLTVDGTQAKRLAAAADKEAADENGMIKITPRDFLENTDFETIWFVGDYSDKNGNTNGGFVAIKMYDVLNTSGFALQTGDRAKGQFAYNFMAHYTAANPDRVPYEMYIAPGADEDGTQDAHEEETSGN